MKTEQIQYIIAIYETGSISKAAEKFYMSRPNMSNSVRSLEKEVGFEILNRGEGKATLTKKGMDLLRHGMNIMKEVEDIKGLVDKRQQDQFSVVIPNYLPAENAFIRLCRDVEEQGKENGYRLSLYRKNQYEGMRFLNQNKADLVVTISTDLSAPVMLREMEKRGLEYQKLWDVPCNVNMSEDHPLAKDRDFSFQKLWDYPYVVYAFDPDASINRIGDVNFVNLSRVIRVDSAQAKGRIISETDAYGVGNAMPPFWSRANHFHCIPIPGFTMEMGYVRRSSLPVTEPEQKFLEFLREEMSFLNEIG